LRRQTLNSLARKRWRFVGTDPQLQVTTQVQAAEFLLAARARMCWT